MYIRSYVCMLTRVHGHGVDYHGKTDNVIIDISNGYSTNVTISAKTSLVRTKV